MLLTPLTSQPALRSLSHVFIDPESAAQWRAMLPSASVMRGSAPRSNRYLKKE
jgi:hypothetical protein